MISETENAEALLQSKLKTLSLKEWEVLNLILQHKSNQQISDELFISPSTLKYHIKQICKKMEVSKRQEVFLILK